MRRKLLPIIFILTSLAALLPFAANGKVEIVVARDLQALKSLAKEKNVPILLAISQDHCPFCHRLKDEILRPMLLSGEYGDKVIIRELLIAPDETLIDFAGVKRKSRDFAAGYQVWVTPTLLFLSPDGRELSARVLGINTIEMYAYYVDDGIDQALARQRGKDPSVYVPSKEDIGFKSQPVY